MPESASPLPTPPVLSTGRVLRVCALYPDLMNIYADRGNLLVLEHRCLWRGIGFELSSSGLGESLDADVHDLYYLGGGQDRDQRLCAEDLIETKRDALHAAAARDAVILGVCGGYQLLGHSYTLGEDEIPGVGLLDVRTVREDGPRLIGNVAIEVSLGEDGVPPKVLTQFAGFENHGGRTYLEPDAHALGRVSRATATTGAAASRARAWQHDRHLPARSPPAQERLVRGLADRHRSTA